MRTRPNPLGDSTSTATATSAFRPAHDHAGPHALHRPPGFDPLPLDRSSDRDPGEPSPSESDATSSKPSGRNQSSTSAGASWPRPHFSLPSWTKPPRTRPSPESACGGRSFPWSPTPDAGSVRTRTVHRSSANSWQFRSAGQRNRLASAANRDSRDRRHHRETMRTTRHSHAGNRDRPGGQRQEAASSYLLCLPHSDGYPLFRYFRTDRPESVRHDPP